MAQATEAGCGDQKRVEDLRCELHEAELAAGLESRAGTIKNVTWSDGVKSILGPTVTSTVEVNGVPTEALLDTGSPVTIVSLDLPWMWWRRTDPITPPEEWRSGLYPPQYL